ncbi:hypothetical protein FA13DRAFT_1732702, partial [Coprinellus micaceus]
MEVWRGLGPRTDLVARFKRAFELRIDSTHSSVRPSQIRKGESDIVQSIEIDFNESPDRSCKRKGAYYCDKRLMK